MCAQEALSLSTFSLLFSYFVARLLACYSLSGECDAIMKLYKPTKAATEQLKANFYNTTKVFQEKRTFLFRNKNCIHLNVYFVCVCLPIKYFPSFQEWEPFSDCVVGWKACAQDQNGSNRNDKETPGCYRGELLNGFCTVFSER